MASKVTRWFEVVLLVLGLVALGILVYGTGTEKSFLGLAKIRYWFVAIIFQELVANAANTWGLLACLSLDRERLGFWRTFASRLAGEGINATMPTATVGGELMKIALLSRKAPAARVTAGISAAYASQALGQMLFTFVALPVSLPLLEKLPVGVRALVAVFVVAGLLVTYWFAGLTRVGAFGFVHGLMRKVRLGSEGSRVHAATAKIDDAARQADRNDPRAFWVSVLAFFIAWAWGVVEVALVLYALGIDVSFSQCLAIESLSTFVDAVFFFVPGQIGTKEGGLAGITFALGMGEEAGLLIGLARRVRILAWAAIGYACLAWLRRETAAPPAAEGESAPAAPATTAP